MEKITINDYHIHYNDLLSFLNLAKEETEEWKKHLFIRQIILKACFALEALINQILIKYSIFRNDLILFNHIEKLSTPNKILSLHNLCENLDKPILEKQDSLYAQIKELFGIRNDWVHGKGKICLDVKQDGTMEWADTEGKNLGNYPYLEIPIGINYHKSIRIPINPFELDIPHGKICIKIVDLIEERIISNFNISKDEIHTLSLFDQLGNKVGDYPINMVWGVYTPKK